MMPSIKTFNITLRQIKYTWAVTPAYTVELDGEPIGDIHFSESRGEYIFKEYDASKPGELSADVLTVIAEEMRKKNVID